MKHVNDPMPNVQKRRPGVSAALSAVVERSTQKEPKKRYPDMGAMLADLEGALEVEIARSGGGTGDTTSVLDSVPNRNRLLSSRTVSIAGILLVLAGVLVALALVEIGGEGEKRGEDLRGDDQEAPVAGAEIELTAAADFDPEGTGGEHPDEVGGAIDGSPESAWTTETYTTAPAMVDNGKAGVGLIVDAGDPVAARQLVLTTDDPGWSGEIYGATDGPPEDLEGWGDPLQSFATDEEETTVELNENESQYFLIWITELIDNPNPETPGFFATIGDVSLTG
jgi:hypothetical protein